MNRGFYEYYNNTLEHAIRGGGGSGSSSERANHKYVNRYWKNGRWNYVYKNKVFDNRRKNVHNSTAGKVVEDLFDMHRGKRIPIKFDRDVTKYLNERYGSDMRYTFTPGKDRYAKTKKQMEGESFADAFRSANISDLRVYNPDDVESLRNSIERTSSSARENIYMPYEQGQVTTKNREEAAKQRARINY